MTCSKHHEDSLLIRFEHQEPGAPNEIRASVSSPTRPWFWGLPPPSGLHGRGRRGRASETRACPPESVSAPGCRAPVPSPYHLPQPPPQGGKFHSSPGAEGYCEMSVIHETFCKVVLGAGWQLVGFVAEASALALEEEPRSRAGAHRVVRDPQGRASWGRGRLLLQDAAALPPWNAPESVASGSHVTAPSWAVTCCSREEKGRRTDELCSQEKHAFGRSEVCSPEAKGRTPPASRVGSPHTPLFLCPGHKARS